MIHKMRLEKAQKGMRDHGIDAYLILTHDDYIYFFGEDRYQPRAIIPSQGAPVIIAFKGEEEEIKKALGVDDVKIFSTVGQQIKDVVEIMRGLSGKQGKITVGLQFGFATPAFLVMMFRRANPQVNVVDIGVVMDEIRMVKEEGEITLIRKAGEIASIGMQAAAKTIRPGVTENEVCAEAEYAMRKAGGLGTATPIYVNSGVRSGWLHGTATEKNIEEGDLVVIDLVPRYKGYCSNYCRTFVAGEPDQKQSEMMSAYKAAQAEAMKALKPGVIIREIDNAAKSVFDRFGYGQYFIPGISHGIGLLFEENPAPTIHPTHSMVKIREGMVLTVGHSVLSIPGIGGTRFEDTFHVTSSGAIPLTNFSL